MRTKSRGEINMYCVGSTIGAARYPRFFNPVSKTNSMLPRPVVNSRPGGLSFTLYQKPWFKEMAKIMENCLFSHLNSLDKTIEYNNGLIKSIEVAKTIPKSLCVCGTIFHQLFIVTSNKTFKEIKPHKDQNDLVNCLLTLGVTVNGGDVIFYEDDLKSYDKMKSKRISIPWEHGRILIGNFNEVLHSVEPWDGSLFFLNFAIKIPILKHFEQHGTKYYDQYEKENFPSKDFLAK